jgi:hypothetical protein
MDKQQLDQLWTAIEYTRGTLSSVSFMSSSEPEWGLCHKGRAFQSMTFLDHALELVNQARKDPRVATSPDELPTSSPTSQEA